MPLNAAIGQPGDHLVDVVPDLADEHIGAADRAALRDSGAADKGGGTFRVRRGAGMHGTVPDSNTTPNA